MFLSTNSGSVYQAFRPWSLSNDCFIAENAKHHDEIAFLTRQYDVVSAALLLYVAKAKSTLPNMRAFFAILIVSCVFGTFFEGETIFAGPCGDTWMAQWYYWSVWPFLALLFGYIERRIGRRDGSASETQPLV